MGVQLEGPDPGSLMGGAWGLEDGDRAERLGAAWSLRRERRAEDVSILVRWLEDGPPGVRAAVATAVGLLGDDSAVPPLASLLADENLDVRHAAAVALRRLGDPRADDALFGVLTAMAGSSDCRDRAKAARTLRGVAAPGAIDLLSRLTEDADEDVRADAAESLRARGVGGNA